VALTVPPDLLVSRDGRLFGVRAADGTLYVSSRAVRRFDTEIWLRRAGEDEAETWPPLGPSLGGRLRCDPLGCIYKGGGQVVALVADGRALVDDCRLATVVISREPDRRGVCRGAGLVIDRFDLWRQGAHALWLRKGGVTVETVAGYRGVRPWTVQRGYRRR
jgi:competence protein ComEC